MGLMRPYSVTLGVEDVSTHSPHVGCSAQTRVTFPERNALVMQ